MGHTAATPRPPHKPLSSPLAPADLDRGIGLQLDQLRSQIAALRFSHLGIDLGADLEPETIRPPFQSPEQGDTPAFPVWLWELRADSIHNAVPCILESRTAAFWHDLYREGIAPRVSAVLAWCIGEGQP
jgi:hypothetical protein